MSLSEPVLENIEADHRMQSEQAYYMLIEWTRRQAATREALYKALLAADPTGSIIKSLTTSD